MPNTRQRLERTCQALHEKLDFWLACIVEIEENAIPITGNKARALRLHRDILQTKGVIMRLMAELPKPQTDR